MLRKLTLDKLTRSHIHNKRVLVRVDFNVPIKNGIITDDTRIRESLDTIRYALDNGAKSVTCISHLGRPDGQKNQKYSLEPIAPVLSNLINKKVEFINDCVGDMVRSKINNPSSMNTNLFLLENLRFYAAEEGSRKDAEGNKIKESKENISQFRKELSSFGDIFVNDAFGTSHRAHSSIVGCDMNLRAAGFLLKKELDFFSRVVENPARPYLVILGGAKVKDKIALIKNLLDSVDKMIITGGMAFTFLKQAKNFEIGKSIFDKDGAAMVNDILAKAQEKNVEILFPEDFVTVKDLKEGEETIIETGRISPDRLGIDVGPQSLARFDEAIANAKTIVLNGANGVFELEIGRKGSIDLIESLTKSTKNGNLTVCGGGDTISLVNSVRGSQISHLSTGGGASLELLEGKVLPGIENLSDISVLENLH